MSAHQMICHLGDSFRAALGEKQVRPSCTLFKRTIYKWVALWVPLQWPHGIKTRPEMDQQKGGTQPVEFASDVEKLRSLFDQFCGWKREFAPHAMLGQLKSFPAASDGYAADRFNAQDSWISWIGDVTIRVLPKSKLQPETVP